MKIVDHATFMAMPPGTVFSKYQPCVFGDLLIKGDTLASGMDFFYQPIVDAIDVINSDEFVDRLEQLRREGAGGEGIAMDFETESRDGMFDEGHLFAVWSRDDVEALIARLSATLESGSER